MSLKERYWKDGYVFRFRDGDRRMVWDDKLIDNHGYIHKNAMSADLVFIHSTLSDRVVSIYKPNKDICCLNDFLKGWDLVWQLSKHMITIDEIKEEIGIPESEELIIIKE